MIFSQKLRDWSPPWFKYFCLHSNQKNLTKFHFSNKSQFKVIFCISLQLSLSDLIKGGKNAKYVSPPPPDLKKDIQRLLILGLFKDSFYSTLNPAVITWIAFWNIEEIQQFLGKILKYQCMHIFQGPEINLKNSIFFTNFVQKIGFLLAKCQSLYKHHKIPPAVKVRGWLLILRKSFNIKYKNIKNK